MKYTEQNNKNIKEESNNIQIDLKSLATQHLMFVGPTGSGMTFTLLMLLMRDYNDKYHY